ncbi:hypothetical protein CHU95_00125, partial [Niveispirillum lacus]
PELNDLSSFTGPAQSTRTWLAAIGLMLTMLLNLTPSRAADADPFGHIADFVGKTWRGEGTGPDGKPMVDLSRWEWALGGRAVRITHILSDLSYGGETLVFWDKARQNLIYHYFTTAGFHTQGVMRAEGPGHLIAEEDVTGHPKITKVRSTMVIQNGILTTQAEFLADGRWAPGHSITYRAAAAQELPPFPKAR